MKNSTIPLRLQKVMAYKSRLEGERRSCASCSKKFLIVARNQKYCSRYCGRKVWGGARPRERSKCIFCNEEFPFRGDGKVYCSTSCGRLARLNAKGLNKTEQEWNNLREFVLERDNYACQGCGLFFMDKGLEAHHVIPLFKSGVNEESNLVSLCHNCHKERHRV